MSLCQVTASRSRLVSHAPNQVANFAALANIMDAQTSCSSLPRPIMVRLAGILTGYELNFDLMFRHVDQVSSPSCCMVAQAARNHLVRGGCPSRADRGCIGGSRALRPETWRRYIHCWRWPYRKPIRLLPSIIFDILGRVWLHCLRLEQLVQSLSSLLT